MGRPVALEQQRLEAVGVDAATREQTEQFLRECERARYLGGTIAREQAMAVARAIDEKTADVTGSAGRSAA